MAVRGWNSLCLGKLPDPFLPITQQRKWRKGSGLRETRKDRVSHHKMHVVNGENKFLVMLKGVPFVAIMNGGDKTNNAGV